MKYVLCDACGDEVSGDILEHVAVYMIGRKQAPTMHYCPECAIALAELIDNFAGRESPAQRRRRELDERISRADAWRATVGERRQRMILEALGDDRLTVRAIAQRMDKRHRDEFGGIYESGIRGEVRKMLDRGEIARERHDKGNRPRYLYFRRAALTGPIAELEAQLAREEA